MSFLLSFALILYIKNMTLFPWFLIYFWNHAFMHLHPIFMLYSCLLVLFICFSKKILKNEKNTKTMYVYVYWYLCTLNGHWNKISKLCISCSLDEHLNAQLSKWALWLVFVMSTIKMISYISCLYQSFWRKWLENPKRKV